MMESLKNFFWRLVYGFVVIKTWHRRRKENNDLRNREKLEYLLHGYRCCMFFHEIEFGFGTRQYCRYPVAPWRERMGFVMRPPRECRKSKKCKWYMYDPVKGC